MKFEFLSVAAAALMFAACNEPLNDAAEVEKDSLCFAKGNEGFILGEKLENPYSLSTMRLAYKQIKCLSKSASANDDFIKATHLYIKFSPKTEEEYDLLTSDTTLDIYPYPLDYDIISYDGDYHDPELPDTIPTYQYASVPYSHKLPNIDYEILDSLFIPFEGKDTEEKSLSKSKEATIWDELEYKALEITNNLTEEDKKQSISKKAKKWRPSGFVKVWDSSRYIGIEGAKIKARRLFTTHTGIADAEGRFSCNGTFKYAATYLLEWERADFKIKDGYISTAKLKGPTKKDCGWYLTVESDLQKFYATIFRAAYYYYYKQKKFVTPPSCNLRAYNYHASGDWGNFSAGRKKSPFTNAIHIYSRNQTLKQIFSTTIHELTHASHWEWSDIYKETSSKIKESWCRGVEYELITDVFGTCDNSYFNEYTPLFEKLRNKCGISIPSLQLIVWHSKTWDDLRNNIKTHYKNANQNDIDYYFNTYATW